MFDTIFNLLEEYFRLAASRVFRDSDKSKKMMESPNLIYSAFFSS